MGEGKRGSGRYDEAHQEKGPEKAPVSLGMDFAICVQ